MPLPGARSLRGAWGPDGGSWESRSPSCGSSRGLLSGVFFTLVKTPKQATPAPDAPTCSSFPHFHILCLSAPTSTSLRARWSAAPAVATGWCRVLVLGPGLHLAPGDRARPPVPAGPPPPRTRRTGDPWPAASLAGWAQGPKSAWAWKHLSLPSRAGERPRRQRANGFPPSFLIPRARVRLRGKLRACLRRGGGNAPRQLRCPAASGKRPQTVDSVPHLLFPGLSLCAPAPVLCFPVPCAGWKCSTLPGTS